MLEELKNRLRARLVAAVAAGAAAGDFALPPEGAPSPADVLLEKPREKAHGDIATNLAMALAKTVRRPPRHVAESLLRHLDRAGTYVAGAEIAGPGFINFRLDPAWLDAALADVLARRDSFGRSNVGAGRRVLVEFVSANPTGPMLVVQARSGAVGDTLCNLLQLAGFEARREFYVNDAGNQVLTLGRSLETRIRQQLGEAVELAEDSYPGEYVIDLARQYLAEHGQDVLAEPPAERAGRLGRWAAERIRAGQERALLDYGVRFDRWASERALRESGAPERVVELLQRGGHAYEADGALWFRSTAFGDDKDRVLRKSDGAYTYVVPDVAYHLDKFERGFDHVIDLLGPDHHGYVGRMRAALQALGKPADAFEVIIVQQVRVMRGGEVVKMSKRGGQFVTMEDLLEEVGRDAARFFFLLRSPDTPLDFDLDLARTQTSENPVFYVQYAHARIMSIMRQAEAAGFSPADGHARPADAGLQPGLLADPAEQELIAHIAGFPEEIARAALGREPHRIPRYAMELATLFHQFYTRCRVLGGDPALTRARLALCEASRITLANALAVLGVSAPERM